MIKLVSVSSNREIIRRIRKIPQSFENGIRQANFLIGSELQKDARRSIIEGPKTGRLYRIRGRRHQASAPFEAPANITGVLKGSITYLVGSRELKFGARARYAGWLEEGTSKMQPRVYLLNTYFRNRRNIENYYYSQITKELTK